MIELVYFSGIDNKKKAYQLIQERPGAPWQVVDGDELIGLMEKVSDLWNLSCYTPVSEGLCTGLAKLIESQHFNQLPDDIKRHWPDQVIEVVTVTDDEYLVICKAGIDLDRFEKVFSSYISQLLRDEWPVVFKIYDSGMNSDFVVIAKGGRR